MKKSLEESYEEVKRYEVDKKILAKFLEKLETFPQVEFRTKPHNQLFKVYCDGESVWVRSDTILNGVNREHKIDDDLINLFNKGYRSWNRDELYKLGKALMELNKPEEEVA